MQGATIESHQQMLLHYIAEIAALRANYQRILEKPVEQRTPNEQELLAKYKENLVNLEKKLEHWEGRFD